MAASGARAELIEALFRWPPDLVDLLGEDDGWWRALVAPLHAYQVLELLDGGAQRMLDGPAVEAANGLEFVHRDDDLAFSRGRELAGKLSKIDHLNVTPDLLATVLGELGKGSVAKIGKA